MQADIGFVRAKWTETAGAALQARHTLFPNGTLMDSSEEKWIHQRIRGRQEFGILAVTGAAGASLEVWHILIPNSTLMDPQGKMEVIKDFAGCQRVGTLAATLTERCLPSSENPPGASL